MRAQSRLLLAVLLVGAHASAAGRRIVIDPGHGGAQEGAVGPDRFVEKVLSLQIAERVKAVLERTLHAQVTLTRTRDQELSLPERVALANRARPDIFISLHANSMPTRRLRERANGIETFFLSASASGEDASQTADRENGGAVKAKKGRGQDDALTFILEDLARAGAHSDSSRLAYAVHNQLIRDLHAGNRGVQQAPFAVLMGVEAPAVLVEVGFISHPVEGKRLESAAYQEKMAAALARGIATFLGQLDARDALVSSARAP